MNNTSLSQLSAQQLRKAAKLKDKLEFLQAELGRVLGGAPVSGPGLKPKTKRKMSAAGRRRIAAAAKARWAKVKAAKKS